MRQLKLSNGIVIPTQIMGTSVWDRKGNKKELLNRMIASVEYCIRNNLAGIDTGRDYHNEEQLGQLFHYMIKNGTCKRDDIFITTKVGNSQQRNRNMTDVIDSSLKSLRLEYVDLWLLHWPLPDYWVENWYQMCDILKTGKVRAIGVANCRERHIETLVKDRLPMPHLVQVEHHPFRTIPSFLQLCKSHNIQVEAYSSNCLMLPFVRENAVLNDIANNHNKSVAQVMTRWHIQHSVIPIFSSFNIDHIKDNVDVYDFELSEEEMQRIYSLNIDYKFHPESINCPGY